MVGFSLEVDYKPQGAAQARRDLDGLATTARRTEATFSQTSQTLSKAFATTGGGISATQGLASAATALNALNTEAALFAGSRALLDIGRTTADFRELAGSVGGARSAFGTLFTIIRANPLLTIATAISTVAAAMSIFGNRTGEATAEVKKQASALDQLLARQRALDIGARLGGGDPRTSIGGLRSAVQSLIETPNFNTSEVSADAIARTFGVSEDELRRAIARSNPNIGEDALTLRPSSDRALGLSRTGGFAVPQFQGSAFVNAGQFLIGERQIQAEGAGLRASEMRLDAERAEQREQARFQAQQDAQNQSLENMRALRAEAEAFGATIGDAFFNVASGTATARQAIAALVSDLARAASRQAFAGLFGSVVGATGTQSSQNIRTVGTEPRV